MKAEQWKEIDSLFHAALELEPSERAAFLARACGADQSLRSEVESLLASHQEAATFIESPAADLAADFMGSQANSMAGRIVGHYRVVSLLGAGGMGEVYLAEDSRLRRKVALKILPSFLTQDAERLQRFKQEARLASSLNHPNIVTIYEIGEQGGTHFIAEEFIEGQTLRKEINRGPMSTDSAVGLAIQIASALAAAHESGIVHRDIKPENVMVRLDGLVKVLDFGLAKLVHPGADNLNDTRRTTVKVETSPGTVMGTLHYMSPEQTRGLEVDARSDLFSFAVVLYEMLTACQPFDGPTPADLIASIIKNEPIPMDSRSPGIPDQLQRIVHKALRKDPEERYQTAKEMLAELTRVRQLIESRTLPRASRKLRRLALAVLVSLLLIVALVVWTSRRPPALGFASRDWIVVTDFENLTGNETFDQSLLTALTVGLAQSKHVNLFPRARSNDTLRRMGREPTTVLDETVASEIALREGIKAVLVCSISRVGARYLVSARLVNPATGESVLTTSSQADGEDQVLEALDTVSKEVREGLGESLANISKSVPLPSATTSSIKALKNFAEWSRLRRSNRQAAMNLLRTAVEIDPDFALAHAELGFEYPTQREVGEEHFKKALSLLDRLTERERLWIHALVEDWRGNREEAIKLFEAHVSQYPDSSDSWFRLGWTRMITGRTQEAIDAFEKVLEIDPNNSSAFVNIATCYAKAKNYDEAIASYERAFSLDPRVLTEVFVNHEYGNVLLHRGEIDKAEATFKRMMEEEILRRPRGYRSMALLRMYQGKYQAAIPLLKQAILMNHANQNKQSELRDRLFLATVYKTKEMRKELVEELRAAREIYSTSKLAPNWLREAGKINARAGNVSEADRLLKELTPRIQDTIAVSSIDRSKLGDQADYNLLKGEVELSRSRSREGLNLFEAAGKIRPDNSAREALAYWQFVLRDLNASAATYRELIENKELGSESQEYWILAHYQIGKIYEQLGNSSEALKYYEMFLNIWRNADQDLPVIVDATRQLQRLRKVTSRS